MKKIISMAIAAVMLVSATFALDFEIGARGILGKTFDNDWGTASEEIKGLNVNTEMDAGFGVYGNFALFGGLGIQAEVNVLKGTIQFTGDKVTWGSAGHTDEEIKKTEFDQWLIDVPLMAWMNLDCWKLTIGFGLGANFSFAMEPSTDLKTIKDKVKETYDGKTFEVGFAAGVDVKFYFTNNLGIVASARYIGNFNETTRKYPVQFAGQDTEVEGPGIEFKRNSLYGGLGIEWKFF